MTDEPLRLRAEDVEDLQVISSCLQDALARIADMRYDQRLQRFAMVVTRFCWERAGQVREGGERSRAGLHFDGVLKVRTRGIDMTDTEGLLPLLSIEARPSGELFEIDLTFGGGGNVQIVAEYVDCHLSDLGESWPTPSRPDHDIASA
jgi:hypothetical protein